MKVDVYDPRKRQVIAQIRLNGYSIAAGGPLGQSGAMRSFTLVQGSLEEQWEVQQLLKIKRSDGAQASVRIAALPAEEGEIGFVEFI